MADIKVTLSLDPGNVAPAADAAAKSIGKIGSAGQISAGQTAAAMRSLPAQFTDIATQLQGGANPLTILLQQGGQIKDQFGGIGPALRGIGSTITPFTAAIGLAVTAVGGVVAGLVAGRAESAAFNRALSITGNVAGETAGHVDALSKSLAASRGVSIGTAREITAALSSTGKLSGAALDSTAAAAASFARVSGESADEVVKSFAGITDGVAAWAAKANGAYNFLTAAQYSEIKALEAQGRGQEAVRITMDALAGTMQQRLTPAVGALEKGWADLKSGVSGLWDTLKSFGRDETAEERIGKLAGKVSMLQGIIDRANAPGGGMLDQMVARMAGAFVPDAQAELGDAQAQKNRADLRRADNAIALKANQQAIEDLSAAHQSALAGIDKAGAAQRLAELGLGYARQLAATNLAFQQGEQSAREHQKALLDIELGQLSADEANLNKLKAIEAARKPANRDEALAQQAALIGFETQRLAIIQKRIKLQADEASGKRDVAPVSTSIGPADALRAFKAKDEANVDEVLRKRADDEAAANAKRVQASIAAQRDLADLTTRLRVDSIADEETRGRALIDIEARTLRDRLDLTVLNAADRRKAEDDLAAYIAARNDQLTEELKPAWQRMVEGWTDTTRLMRAANDDLMGSLVRDGEDAFVQLGRTGKLQVKALVDDIINSMLRVQFRKMVGSEGGKSALGGLSGLLGGSSTLAGGKSAGTDTFGAWEQDLADMSGAAQDSTRALQQSASANSTLTGVVDSLTGGLGSFGNMLLQAAQSLTSLIASSSAGSGENGMSTLMGIVSLFGGGTGYSLTTGGGGMGGANGTGSASPYLGSSGLLGGGRAAGGPVYPQTMHPVNELGVPELLTTGGRQYLMMASQGGQVTPLKPADGAAAGGDGSGGGVVVHLTINNSVGQFVTPGELAQVAEQTRQAAMAGVAQARARGNRAYA